MLRVFRHYVNIPAFFLAAGEATILFTLTYSTSHLLSANGFDIPTDHAFASASVLTAVVLLAMSAVGLYNRAHFVHRRDVLSRTLVVFPLILIFISQALLGYGWLTSSQTQSGYYVLAGTGLLLFLPVLLGVRELFLLLVDHFDGLKRRVLVVGSGPRAAKIDRLSRDMLDRAYTIVGFVRLDHPQQQPPSVPLPQGNRRTSHRRDDYQVAAADLADFCAANAIDELVVASTERRGLPVQDLLACKLRGIQVVEYTTFWERESGQVDLHDIAPSWLIFCDGFKMNTLRAMVKRSFDIVISSILLVLTLPLTIPSALLIILESRGPIFYRQERVGLNGKPFWILKFRSMQTDAEKDGPRWAAKNDSRVTRVGAFLRKVRIDEIPQVLNVLKGEMSFVGPRPERPVFVEKLINEIPYYNNRHVTKPGITGWAQINYPYGATIEDAKMKLSYDLYYIKNNSLFLDVLITIQTLNVLLWNKGAR
ncbi:TIGR03013 family XrtA/PEP-CTERM system glycosyltransferase [Magnetospirillum molischianum]|uniref:Sugar transferase n=1 Tax=Magnetospirillum molischianum DSM 120 TaxID=1150626 RepID=H8FQC1_MAGML|nr:TIGR03013 family XrtA/PEP-CTERM system glycosyltransferase [Magnetospirillum molischianum]CCG40559.1 Sugar transferase [Magnetospirillum molischianum DSM 120]